MQMTIQQQFWNWMSYGHLSSKRSIKPGYGLHSVGKHDKLSLMQWETEAKKHAKSYGIIFQKNIAKGIAIVIFGKLTKLSFQKINTQRKPKETGETAHVERWNN